ncbi:MAG TPA: HAD-IC family P-type ATPase [Kofleriaceae bacterium]|jgi:Ca2+-transporting ATPase|nr:HAD-IC family P-type ATPase [Kofleriaceae bacterium]
MQTLPGSRSGLPRRAWSSSCDDLSSMAGHSETPWHALDVASAIEQLATDPRRGLDADAVGKLRLRHGPNELPAAHQRPLWLMFVSQFRSPLIYLLFGAAAVALLLHEAKDAIVIFVVVVLNALIGAYQEGRAERALVTLRQLASRKARVIRDGGEQVIDARELVPGDLLVLAAGDGVSADARVIDHAALQISEAALTGESVPVSKTTGMITRELAIADRTNMVYAGTHVTAGRARAVVIATGTATEIGHIAALTEDERPHKTPLERRIETFGHHVMIIAAFTFAVFVGLGVVARVPLAEIVMVGISQVVGLIPESLPVAMTVALAVGVRRIAKRRAIVRRLSAVETLGSTTVICTDKTGTLTRNEMTVTALWLPGRGVLAVTGVGYAPEGKLLQADAEVSVESADDVRRLAEACVLCNDAQVLGPDDRDPRWRTVGDPTEAALVTLAMKTGVVPDAVRREQPRRAEIPFDSAILLMATQHETPADRASCSRERQKPFSRCARSTRRASRRCRRASRPWQLRRCASWSSPRCPADRSTAASVPGRFTGAPRCSVSWDRSTRRAPRWPAPWRPVSPPGSVRSWSPGTTR